MVCLATWELRCRELLPLAVPDTALCTRMSASHLHHELAITENLTAAGDVFHTANSRLRTTRVHGLGLGALLADEMEFVPSMVRLCASPGGAKTSR